MNIYLICAACFIVGLGLGTINILVSIVLMVLTYFGTKYYVDKYTRDLGGIGIWMFAFSGIVGLLFGIVINFLLKFFI